MRHRLTIAYDQSKVDSSPAELHGKALSGFFLHLGVSDPVSLQALHLTAQKCLVYIAEGTPCSLGGSRDYVRQAFLGNIAWERLPDRGERLALVEQLLEGYLAGGYIDLRRHLEGAPPLEIAIRCYAWPVAAAFIRHGADETSVGATEYRPPEPREGFFEYIARKVEEPARTYMVPAVTEALMWRQVHRHHPSPTSSSSTAPARRARVL